MGEGVIRALRVHGWIDKDPVRVAARAADKDQRPAQRQTANPTLAIDVALQLLFLVEHAEVRDLRLWIDIGHKRDRPTLGIFAHNTQAER
jgi:hypothetical protein